ncbi:MAG: hypothetical protein JJU29_21905 [Verrucomicrobia bacterium]|nr:hypothetical protein [Verrucomicrobiota bacterium]MCH8513711.1 hypothetical protein [Kiritimatiellia bacterium]
MSKNLRMQGWDFTSPGGYFVTICTKHMRPAFGTVVGGHMVLNDAGRIADKFWCEIPEHFPHVVLDEHVVMPDHVHGLLIIPAACEKDIEQSVHSPTACRGGMEAFGKPVAGSIPTVIRSYKGAVTKALSQKVWHPRFYEVRARDERARNNIRRYIRDNPANYQVVRGANPVCLGNQALLKQPMVAFLASRGPTRLPGPVPFAPGEVVISGFLSALERQVFREGMRDQRPMIWVVPHGLKARQIHNPTACRGAKACREAIDEGRLLLVSPFPETIDTPNARRASWCNHYAITLADRIILGHLNPDGMLACILSEANPDKEVIQL